MKGEVLRLKRADWGYGEVNLRLKKVEGASFRPQVAVSKPQGADHKLKRAD